MSEPRGTAQQAVTREAEAWLEARLPREDLARRVRGIDAGFRVTHVQLVGFPYLVATFSWSFRKFGLARREVMHCAVDRCQGVSTTLETLALGEAMTDAFLPEPAMPTAALERLARRHMMQTRRHQLKRRDAVALHLEGLQHVRKPLWRVQTEHADHGAIPLLVDGITGGYLLLNA